MVTKKKSLDAKASESWGKTPVCSGCPFWSTAIEPNSPCKTCRAKYIDGYKAGYKRAQRDIRERNKAKSINS